MITINRTFLISVLTLYSIASFGGGGNSYRYKVRLSLDNYKGLTEGYIYYGTFDIGYTKDQGSFKDFILKNYKDSLNVFPDIKPLKKDHLETDFVIKEKGIKIHKDNILEIELMEEKKNPLGEGLDFVNEAEFKIIKPNPNKIESIYNEKAGENCGYVFISWTNDDILQLFISEFNNKLNELLHENNFRELNNYIDRFKKETVKSNILFYQHCGMM